MLDGTRYLGLLHLLKTYLRWFDLRRKRLEDATKGIHNAKAQKLRPNINGWEMLSLEESFVFLERLPGSPSVENLTTILQNCRKVKNRAYAQRLHAYICKYGLESHRSLGNYLVPMLVEVGSMCDAQQVFNRLVYQNEYSWTSLITGYIECGESQHALNLYQKMQEDCVNPSGHTFVALLKACARLKDLEKGQKLHAQIARQGLERDLFVGNSLVNMYAKCDSLAKAQEVFDKLLLRDVVSWNALIAAYAEQGLGEEALTCLEQMHLEGMSPDAFTFACGLKACGSIGDINKGREMHSEIARKGLLESDPFVGNSLVDMYAKCGLLAKAREVFDELPVQNVIAWTALITGYSERGLGKEALNIFENMQLEGVSPDALTFLCSLKACGSIGAIDKGREIHDEITRKGLDTELCIGTGLVDMYAKCGSLAKAQEVFDKLLVRNVASWTALIAGYTKHGLGEEALDCFEWMLLEEASPDAHTFVCSLKACGNIGAADRGGEIHAEIERKGLIERDPCVGNALIDMYVNCELLAKAREVFDKLPIRDVVSWNALITGYAKHRHGQEALNCFEQMLLEGVPPNAVTFVCSLKACASIGAIDKGQRIEADVFKNGLLKTDPCVGNALVNMYAKCGSLVTARKVFDKLPVRDTVSWTALMSGYAEHGFDEDAMKCFEEMQVDGVLPNTITFACSLKACGSIGAIDKGQEIHAEIIMKGLLEREPFVGNMLVDMYAKCGWLAKAQEVFDKLPVQTVAAWNALIMGYAKHGLGEEALNCVEQMQLEGVSPDAQTFVCILKACCITGATDKGQKIHVEVGRKGLLEIDPCVGNALIDMYAKCGLFAKAQEVLDKLQIRDVISWTSLIAGYAKHGLGEEALNCLEWMEQEGVSPDALTYVCILKACGSIGATDKGREIHAEIAKKGLLERDPCVGNALVDMYAKCGALGKAWEVFENLPARDVVSFTALITGYAHFGESESVFHMLERMSGEGIRPNEVTFCSVFAVCSHTGLVDKGQKYFESMSKDYGVSPTIGHHACLVDLLSRAGQLEEAVAMMIKMPFHPNHVMCHTVLGACRKWGNVELGRQAFEYAVQLDEKDVAAYVLMSNIYADAHMHVDEKMVEAMQVKLA